MGQFVDKLIVDETILQPIAKHLDTIKNTTDLLSIIRSGEIYHIDAKVETDVDKLYKKKQITEEQHNERAVFVGVIKQGDDERQIMEYLDELEFLAETAGAIGVKKFIQKVDRPDSRTYIRSGKLQEIKDYISSFFVHNCPLWTFRP